MDVDKKYPLSILATVAIKTCEVALDVPSGSGMWSAAASSWAAVTQTGEENES